MLSAGSLWSSWQRWRLAPTFGPTFQMLSTWTPVAAGGAFVTALLGVAIYLNLPGWLGWRLLMLIALHALLVAVTIRYARREAARAARTPLVAFPPPPIDKRDAAALQHGRTRWDQAASIFDLGGVGLFFLVAPYAGYGQNLAIEPLTDALGLVALLLLMAVPITHLVYLRPLRSRVVEAAEQEYELALGAVALPASTKIDQLRRTMESLRDQLETTMKTSDEVEEALVLLSNATEEQEAGFARIMEAAEKVRRDKDLTAELNAEETTNLLGKLTVIDAARKPERVRSRWWDVLLSALSILLGFIASQLVPDGTLLKWWKGQF